MLSLFLIRRHVKEQKDSEDPKCVSLKVYNRDMESPDSSGYVSFASESNYYLLKYNSSSFSRKISRTIQ